MKDSKSEEKREYTSFNSFVNFEKKMKIKCRKWQGPLS